MRETLLEKIVHWVVGAFLTAVGGWLAKQHNPLYHSGWMDEHIAWVPLPLVVVLIALVACLSKLGFVIVSLLAVFGAVAFGYFYGSAEYQNGGWPLFTWVLHLIELSLVVGVVAGAAARLTPMVKRYV